MEKNMIKAGRYDLNEASLGRVYQHVVSNPKMKNWLKFRRKYISTILYIYLMKYIRNGKKYDKSRQIRFKRSIFR